MHVGRTPMQVLEQHLVDKGYIYLIRENPSTNAGKEILFIWELPSRGDG